MDKNQGSKEILVIIGDIFIGALVMWLCWPVIIKGIFPFLIERGYVIAKPGYWIWVLVLLFKDCFSAFKRGRRDFPFYTRES